MRWPKWFFVNPSEEGSLHPATEPYSTSAEVPQAGLRVQPAVINPRTDDHHALNHAEYRLGAILRDREQRKAEKRPPNRDHDLMTAEGLSHAALLFGSGRHTKEEFDEVRKRLEA